VGDVAWVEGYAGGAVVCCVLCGGMGWDGEGDGDKGRGKGGRKSSKGDQRGGGNVPGCKE